MCEKTILDFRNKCLLILKDKKSSGYEYLTASDIEEVAKQLKTDVGMAPIKDEMGRLQCPICKHNQPIQKYKYCPFCGQKINWRSV